MDNLFLIIFLLSALALIAGMIKPDLVLKFLDGKKRNRKHVLLIFASSLIASFILFGITAESVDEQVNDNQEKNIENVEDNDKKDNTEDSLSMLSKEDKELLEQPIAELTNSEQWKINKILKSLDNYKESDQKLILKHKDRLEKEKIAFDEEKKKEKELSEANPNKSDATQAPKEPASIPEGKEDVTVNDNIPHFSNEDITSTDAYHRNGPLDSLGRVTAANAVVGVEIMPAGERGDIGHHKPTGWNQRRYAGIGAGGWLYNRSHLIGHQMTGNDDYANLMTGTRWFNMRMLEYENFVANYVESTENHVRYRVTPVFEGDNLVASGAYMEGFSIEDNGEALMFNVYVPNIQPGVEISYADGSSVGPEGPSKSGTVKDHPSKDKSEGSQGSKVEADSSSSKDVSSVDTNGNGTVTIKEAKDAGYSMPVTDDHWLYQYMIDRDGDGMVGE